MTNGDSVGNEAPGLDYTAFRRVEYRQLIYREEHERIWIKFDESFYRASEVITELVANGRAFPDIEGVAAAFLFRHYLELALKRIVLRGRFLESRDVNAVRENVREVAKIHNLKALWMQVLSEAKPKIAAEWEGYDTEFIANCIEEFHNNDESGFTLRYPRLGGERLQFAFSLLPEAMRHVYEVLEGITTCLVQLHADNAEYDEILRQDAGY